MLVVTGPRGLTRAAGSGKKFGAAGSEHGMTTYRPRTPGACASPGPPVDVVAWRSCRLREAGFPLTLADALAGQHVDLHALLQLVDAGCAPDLAARILSPADDTRISW